jgi:hypothetical protein
MEIMDKKISVTIKKLVLLCPLITFVMILLIFNSCLSDSFAISEKQRFDGDSDIQLSEPFLLPFGLTQSIPNHGGIQDSKNQIGMLSIINRNIPLLTTNSASCSSDNLMDNFGNTTYKLEDGQTSPNGKWQNMYSGFGSTGVEFIDGNFSFFLKPKIPTSSGQTSSALVTSTDTFCNYVLNTDIKTVKQLRQNSNPNAWEVGWLIFRYTDTFHYYWFLVKPNGIELGKKDCDTCTDPVEGQQYLVTKNIPTLQLNKWSHWIVNIIGNHIKISVDNKAVIDFIDQSMSTKLNSGSIGMYSEDAYVRYDNMDLKSQ